VKHEIPLSHGEPQIGGIRPGPDTGHTQPPPVSAEQERSLDIAGERLELASEVIRLRAELQAAQKRVKELTAAYAVLSESNAAAQERERALIRGYRILAAKHPDDSDYEANIVAGFSHAKTRQRTEEAGE